MATVRRIRLFYTGMAVLLAASAFAGFAPSFYLRGYVSLPPGLPPLSPLIIAHAIIATAWVVLFVAQAALVAANRTGLHRRMGVAGAALAIAMTATGALATIEALRRGASLQGFDPRAWWFGTTFPGVVVFALLAGAGLAYRRRPEAHKRLMLLATINAVAPGLSRIAIFNLEPFWLPVFGVGGPALLLLIVVAHDAWSRGRVHPALLWGGLGMLATPFVMRALATTAPALRLADLLL